MPVLPAGNTTHPPEDFSLTSTCSTDLLDWPGSSPSFLLATSAASGPIAASISFGSTSSNQMSALVSINLISLSSLKVTVHLYSVQKADLSFRIKKSALWKVVYAVICADSLLYGRRDSMHLLLPKRKPGRAQLLGAYFSVHLLKQIFVCMYWCSKYSLFGLLCCIFSFPLLMFHVALLLFNVAIFPFLFAALPIAFGAV